MNRDESSFGCSEQAVSHGMRDCFPVRVLGHISEEHEFLMYERNKSGCYVISGDDSMIADRAKYARDTAIILRVMADNWEAWAEGKIDEVDNPCVSLADAVADNELRKIKESPCSDG